MELIGGMENKIVALEKMLAIAEEALRESANHFHSIMSGITTDIKQVEQMTKQLAYEARIEAIKALSKIEELKK